MRVYVCACALCTWRLNADCIHDLATIHLYKNAFQPLFGRTNCTRGVFVRECVRALNSIIEIKFPCFACHYADGNDGGGDGLVFCSGGSTIEWEATTAHGEVYSADDEEDLPLNGMNTNACQFTTCPIRASTKQSYTYTLPLAKKFPVVCISLSHRNLCMHWKYSMWNLLLKFQFFRSFASNRI